jgi:hypothetical protein
LSLRPILGRAVGAALVAATVVVVPVLSGPATAAMACAGVTVVVDPQRLGGSPQQKCDGAGGGKSAAAVFEEAGVHLSYATSGGMVCRVNGVPASDPCHNNPPPNAYWSLWWSAGDSGTWTYSSLGAGALKIPAGGSVAWSWQGQQDKAPPGISPSRAAPTPTASQAPPPPSGGHPKKPRPKPTKRPVRSTPTAEPTTSSATPSPSAPVASSATPTPKRSPRSREATSAPPTTATPTPTLDPTPSLSPTTEVTQDATEQTAADEGGLPGWVPPLIVVVLVAAAGGIGWARRAR